MEYVIIDFNGTIVDDLDLSLNAINHTINKYLDRNSLTKKEYREIFTFPVKKYYENAGFDFDELNWLEVGQTWMDYYQEHRCEAGLHDGIIDFLKTNHQKGYKNVVLSASEINLLKEQLKELKIYDYLDDILGIDNIYASSKLPIALNFMKDKDPKECVFIGDTGHDKDVADAMGIRCILVAKGHESKERLCKICKEVYDDISEVKI